MELSRSLAWFWALLVAVGAMRLGEMMISKRRQRRLAARGVARVKEPHFGAMVALHTAILLGAGIEATVWRRAANPWLTIAALVLVAGAIALRWWVITTLGPHWNVQIMDSAALDVVDGGPFRHVRHPNYVAVFVELLALPLVHGAWVTAIVGSLAHVWVLAHRVRAEEAALLSHPGYVARMGHKPRFLPRFLPFGSRSVGPG